MPLDQTCPEKGYDDPLGRSWLQSGRDPFEYGDAGQ
jgi:hypothetical protein